MRILGTIFAFLFAVIAVPLFTFAACNASLMASYLNRATFDSLLEDDSVFEDLISVALPAVFSLAEGENMNIDESSPVRISEVSRILPHETWEEVSSLLIPPNWLQTTLSQVLDVIFGIVDGNVDAIEQEVSLVEVRQRFLGDEAQQAATLIITEAPACSQTQIDQLRRFLTNDEGSLPICNPTDSNLQEQSIAYLVSFFAAIGNQLGTDTVSFQQFFSIEPDNARAFYLLVELDRQGLLLLYLCPMALLSLLVIFAVRSLKGFGRWLGGTAIATGLSIILLIFGLQVIVFGIVSEILRAETDIEQFFAEVFSSLLRSAFGHSSANLLFQAALFIALGFILLVVAWYASHRDDDTDGEVVVITDDGEIISTASQKRIGTVS